MEAKSENNCHCVIDKPESVNLKIPTIIIIDIIKNMNISHGYSIIYFEIFTIHKRINIIILNYPNI